MYNLYLSKQRVDVIWSYTLFIFRGNSIHWNIQTWRVNHREMAFYSDKYMDYTNNSSHNS